MAGDLFRPSERGRATMAMSIAEIAGAPAAFALGGMLLVHLDAGHRVSGSDWSEALLWMAAVLIPVIVIMLALREPRRRESLAKNVNWRAALPELWKCRHVAVPLQLGRATLFIADGSLFVWGAPMLARRFHLEADQIGSILGLVLLIGGTLGPAIGGPLVDYCQRSGGPRRAMKILAWISVLSAPLALFGIAPDWLWASVLMTGFLVMGFMLGAAAIALTLTVIPADLRGLNLGISLVVGSLFFVGLAPLVVSSLSGLLGGEQHIGESLAIVCLMASLINAVVLGVSAKHFPDSCAR